MLRIIEERVELLRKEAKTAYENVDDLTNKLEQAKIHLNQITGHFNEAAHLLNVVIRQDKEMKEQIAEIE
jgi:uncharacterized membrane-anchored protein YhcB (DUF1043 family)